MELIYKLRDFNNRQLTKKVVKKFLAILMQDDAFDTCGADPTDTKRYGFSNYEAIIKFLESENVDREVLTLRSELYHRVVDVVSRVEIEPLEPKCVELMGTLVSIARDYTATCEKGLATEALAPLILSKLMYAILYKRLAKAEEDYNFDQEVASLDREFEFCIIRSM